MQCVVRDQWFGIGFWIMAGMAAAALAATLALGRLRVVSDDPALPR
ncbi:hypothetical protein JNW88_14895 [Micromonospora sp. ATA32]|nr:hypothetical protein [Micromonospora sp. ATA32]